MVNGGSKVLGGCVIFRSQQLAGTLYTAEEDLGWLSLMEHGARLELDDLD